MAGKSNTGIIGYRYYLGMVEKINKIIEDENKNRLFTELKIEL